jgi:hypothetical protein
LEIEEMRHCSLDPFLSSRPVRKPYVSFDCISVRISSITNYPPWEYGWGERKFRKNILILIFLSFFLKKTQQSPKSSVIPKFEGNLRQK